MPMNFRYTTFQKTGKRMLRTVLPAPHSSAIVKTYDNVCAVEFVSPKKLRAFFGHAIKELRNARGEDIGDYLEFGVFNGSSMAAVVSLCKDLGITATRFFGFDAFEGLPAEAEKEDGGVWRKGAYECSFETMQDCLRQRGVDPNAITWLKGWFNETATSATAQQYGITNPGIIFVDCDTYGASKTVLDFVAPLIKKPMVICLDDWELNDLDLKDMGEYQAFNEFLEAHPRLHAREITSYKRDAKCFFVEPH